MKQALNEFVRGDWVDAQVREREALCASSADLREGLAAWRDRRSPRFDGRLHHAHGRAIPFGNRNAQRAGKPRHPVYPWFLPLWHHHTAPMADKSLTRGNRMWPQR